MIAYLQFWHQGLAIKPRGGREIGRSRVVGGGRLAAAKDTQIAEPCALVAFADNTETEQGFA